MKNKKLIIIVSICLFLLLVGASAYLLRPQFIVEDFAKNIEINYQDKYKSKYGNICYGNKIMCKKVIVKEVGSVDTDTLGSYNIEYDVSYKKKSIKLEQKVEVVDKEKPQIEVTSEDNLICPNGKIEKLEYSATDNHDGELTDNVQTKIIDNNIVLSVSDSSGNEQSLTVDGKIEDKVAPEISLNGKKKMTITLGNAYKEPGATATDNCDDVEVKINGSVDTNTVGTYKIEYKSTDLSGNITTLYREVKVVNKVINNPNNGAGSKIVYLTFDDGPSAYTEHLLDVLSEYNVKATFFVTKNGSDSTILREYQEGHTVALHTYTHDYSYVYSSVENYYEDLYRIQSRVQSITGQTVNLIRFPGGSSNTTSHNYDGGAKIMSFLVNDVQEKGFIYFDWNVSSGDAGGTTSSDGVYNNVIRSLKSGSSVVLQHDTKKFSVDAVQRIIEYGLNNGYTFKALDASSPTVHHKPLN
ncbi:MAG: polysaccharide deacetylase family protein [Bacilli bacterium]|nr:polysaccharide deacetylase family protein [Bacilli bacterium]